MATAAADNSAESSQKKPGGATMTYSMKAAMARHRGSHVRTSSTP